MYTREELNTIATCIDIAVRRDGVISAKTLGPLYEKTEAIAKAMDDAKNTANVNKESGEFSSRLKVDPRGGGAGDPT